MTQPNYARFPGPGDLDVDEDNSIERLNYDDGPDYYPDEPDLSYGREAEEVYTVPYPQE